MWSLVCVQIGDVQNVLSVQSPVGPVLVEGILVGSAQVPHESLKDKASTAGQNWRLGLTSWCQLLVTTNRTPVSHVVHGRRLHLCPWIVPKLCLCLKSNSYKPIQMLGVDKMLKLDCWETEALLLTMHLQLQPSEPILSTCVFWKALGAFSATYMQIMKAPCIYLFLRIICMRM